jgi:hypothetical protein
MMTKADFIWHYDFTMTEWAAAKKRNSRAMEFFDSERRAYKAAAQKYGLQLGHFAGGKYIKSERAAA